jgi:hypothetical protein
MPRSRNGISRRWAPSPGTAQIAAKICSKAGDHRISPRSRMYWGYGNDSLQTGPSSSRFLHIACPTGFAFSVETRPQQLAQRQATTPEIAHEAGFGRVFRDVPVSGLVSAKTNRGRVCRPLANPIPLGSGVGQRSIGICWPGAASGASASQSHVRSDARANGPVCRESLPYPEVFSSIQRHEIQVDEGEPQVMVTQLSRTQRSIIRLLGLDPRTYGLA